MSTHWCPAAARRSTASAGSSVSITRGTRSHTAKPFLVDNKFLGQEFRQCYLRRLNSLHRRGKLKLQGQLAPLQDPQAWKSFSTASANMTGASLSSHRRPASRLPEHVLKYLARYMTGGPISDHRLVSCENDMVTFISRSKDKPNPNIKSAKNFPASSSRGVGRCTFYPKALPARVATAVTAVVIAIASSRCVSKSRRSQRLDNRPTRQPSIRQPSPAKSS